MVPGVPVAPGESLVAQRRRGWAFFRRVAARVVAGGVGRLTLRHRVLLVSDGAGWILDRVAESIRDTLPAGLRAQVVIREWRYARRCVIHFIDRSWAWSDEPLADAQRANELVALWWHGRIDSEDEAMARALERVRRLHEWFARVQVTCRAAREAMLACDVPERKIVVLPEGVDLMRFQPARHAADRADMRRQLGVPDGAIAIGSFQKDGVGWEDGAEPKLIKGPDVLAEALIRLAGCHEIYVVIPGPARGYLRRRLSEAGVSHTAPGFVADAEIPRYYHALDLYVSPSRDEGGPAGVLESMASGVPVIATRVGMAPDLIQHGMNGFLVDVEDVDGLVACMDELIEGSDLRRAFAERGLETIRPYDWPVLGWRYAEELYRPLLNARKLSVPAGAGW